MTPGDGPFDPAPDGADTHLVLTDGAGRLSLWPVWRALPDGWTVLAGAAPYAVCVARVEREGALP
ncbi:MbtH family NRPS accessory protein [Streptomyces bauhiniae]